MPFIRVNEQPSGDVHHVNVANIISFSQRKGDKFTRLDLRDNLSLSVSDTPRQLRGYINKVEGLLEDRAELVVEGDAPPLPVRLPGIHHGGR